MNKWTIDNLNAFDMNFFLAHPEVHLSESSRYFKRLKCKPLNDICIITNYKQLCTVASQLQINQYKSKQSMCYDRWLLKVSCCVCKKKQMLLPKQQKTKAHFEVHSKRSLESIHWNTCCFDIIIIEFMFFINGSMLS